MNQITQARATWRKYVEEASRKEIKSPLHIGLAASFTANSFIPFLGATMSSAGLNPSIEIGPYNQIFSICVDYKSIFGAKCEVIILLYRLEDIALEEIQCYLHGDSTALERAIAKLDFLLSALDTLRRTFGGSIIVNLPPFPTALSVHALNLENPYGLGALHRALSTRFIEQVRNIKGIHLCDFDAVQRECGIKNSFDSRQWYLYRQPFTDSFLFEAGTLLGRMLVALRNPPKKCVVLDCDNTLWGGVIGEDGLGGIELGDEFPGTAYRDFQRFLLYLCQKGIFLALASKNNETDVWEVFDKHGGMLLKREHISAWQINWESKHENILKIAKSLNIGVDSLVFIDDNPMEIDLMRTAQPEVHSVLLPEDPADILFYIRNLALFDRCEVTEEDRQRVGMMHAEKQRKLHGQNLTKEGYLRSLDLRLVFFQVREQDLERVTQLINKTNQFNLTTIRRSLDEVRVLTQSPKHRIFGLRVSDKFGDYGLTGVVICEISDDHSQWFVDTLLLSCRVLGRGVETALLATLASKARIDNASELIAFFTPTAKNAVAFAFLRDHGFQTTDERRWHIKLAEVPAFHPSVTLVQDESDKIESPT